MDTLAGGSRSASHFRAASEPTVPFYHPAVPGHDISGAPAEPDSPGDSPAGAVVGFPEAAPPSHGAGRWLRGLIGVDEGLLDRVWEERARYTGLGAIVLGTAAMA